MNYFYYGSEDDLRAKNMIRPSRPGNMDQAVGTDRPSLKELHFIRTEELLVPSRIRITKIVSSHSVIRE